MTESEQEKKSASQRKPSRDPNLGQKEAKREKTDAKDLRNENEGDELEPMKHEEE